MTEKTITGWLIVDWKNDQHRTRKSEPNQSDLGAYELPAKLSVDVTVPEVDTPELALEIDVPEPQVFAAHLEAIDDEDLPDWSDTAAEQIDDHAKRFDAAAGNTDAWTNTVDAVTTRVLMDAQGRPKAERVREYVDKVARDTFNDD